MKKGLQSPAHVAVPLTLVSDPRDLPELLSVQSDQVT